MYYEGGEGEERPSRSSHTQYPLYFLIVIIIVIKCREIYLYFAEVAPERETERNLFKCNRETVEYYDNS